MTTTTTNTTTTTTTTIKNHINAEHAKLWKRLFSSLYDSLILAAISLFYFAIATAISTLVFNNQAQDFQPNTSGIFVQLGWLASILAFYCFFWLRVGQTVAMKAWHLKLISENNDKLTLKQCLIRCIAGAACTALFGLGWWWCWFDKDGLCLHDRLSKTRIVQLPKGS